MHELFNSPVLRVEQPRRAPSAVSRYKLFDGRGTLVARAAERDISAAKKTLRTVTGDGGGRRVVHVEAPDGRPLLTVVRVPGSRPGAQVGGPDGGAVFGTISQADDIHRFTVVDAAGRPLGHLDANRLLRRFAVHDAAGSHVAQLDKKWKGLATELVTTADRYTLEIFRALPDPLRTMVVMTPLAIDLMLYEGKDWPV